MTDFKEGDCIYTVCHNNYDGKVSVQRHVLLNCGSNKMNNVHGIVIGNSKNTKSAIGLYFEIPKGYKKTPEEALNYYINHELIYNKLGKESHLKSIANLEDEREALLNLELADVEIEQEEDNWEPCPY